MWTHFRTRCADENEEEITEEEIQTLFPNYATTDFGEFIQNPTLESNPKQSLPLKPKQTQDLLTDDDLKFVGDVFIDIMFKYSRWDMISLFYEQIRCFNILFLKIIQTLTIWYYQTVATIKNLQKWNSTQTTINWNCSMRSNQSRMFSINWSKNTNTH